MRQTLITKRTITSSLQQKIFEGVESLPISVTSEEVTRHYAGKYDVMLIVGTEAPGGLKGKSAAKKNVWLLKK